MIAFSRALVAAACMAAANASANVDGTNVDGTLDTSLHPPLGAFPYYGTAGLIDFAIDFGGAAPHTNNDYASSVLARPDGKIVVAGQSWTAGATISNHVGVVARFLSDGVLDSSFGTGGTALFGDANQLDFYVTSIAQQHDKLLVAATFRWSSSPATEYARLMRLDENGSLANTPIGDESEPRPNHGFNKVITDEQGDIYIAGYWNSPSGTRFEVTFAGQNGGAGNEYTFNYPLGPGTQDGARATDLILRHMPALACGNGCLIPAHDELLAIGNVYMGDYVDGLPNHDCVVWAFRRGLMDLTFSIDTAFNNGQPLRIDFPVGSANEGDNYCRAVAARIGSGVVVGGENYFISTLGGGTPGLASTYALAEVDEAGNVTRQDAFAFFQELATPGIFNGIFGMRREAGGKLVVAGYAGTSAAGRGPADVGAIRFNADYSRDVSFGSDGAGLAILSLDGTLAASQREWASALAFDTQGRVVIAGNRSYNIASNDDYDWLIARLNNTDDVIFRDGFDPTVP